MGYGVATAALVLPRRGREDRDRLIREWSARMLRILKVKLDITGGFPPQDHAPALFVSNHVSWLDIWALNAVRPMRFIAKSEVRAWPVIGWLSERAGVIFIERAKRLDTARVSEAGTQALLEGHSVCVFPEGTTSDGTHIHPFRSSLLQAAVDASAPVWPVALHYPAPSGGANQAVAYVGEMTLAESLWAVLDQKEIVVRLAFGEPIHAMGRDRRQLAKAAEAAIASLARLPVRAAPGTPSDPPA